MPSSHEFLEHFPPGFKMRPSQHKVLEEIFEAINTGYKNIILCAPTGIGKSHIAATFARYFGSSSVITRQKILQRQYVNSFGFFSNAMGRQNYPCMILCTEKGIPYEDGTIRSAETSCQNGSCTWDGEEKKEFCPAKPSIKDFEIMPGGGVIDPLDKCLYYTAKYHAMLSKHTVYNYASFFSFNFFTPDEMKRKSLVADEAHEIEDSMVDFCSMSIPNDGNRVRDVDDLARVLQSVASDAPSDAANQMQKRKCEQIIYQIKKDPANVVFSIGKHIEVKLVNLSSISKKMFNAPCQLFMSGTIHAEPFRQMMGFDSRDCTFIEVPKSPFAAKNRQIQMCDTARLNQNSTPEDYDTAYAKISEILEIHKDEKGLILTTSKKQCDEIIHKIKDRKLIPVHSGSQMTRDEALGMHEKYDGPSVLVSPSLWSGVDLKGDISTFQIILKVPYPSMADFRVQAMLQHKHNQVWYKYNALMRLIQGMGRSIRTEDDHAITYVIDSSAINLISSMKKYIPMAYQDTIK